MSARTVLVRCPACGGTGLGVPAHLQCDVCLGQSHVAIDRARDGGVPDGYTEWAEYDIGPTPYNPLRLTYRTGH